MRLVVHQGFFNSQTKDKLVVLNTEFNLQAAKVAMHGGQHAPAIFGKADALPFVYRRNQSCTDFEAVFQYLCQGLQA